MYCTNITSKHIYHTYASLISFDPNSSSFHWTLSHWYMNKYMPHTFIQIYILHKYMRCKYIYINMHINIYTILPILKDLNELIQDMDKIHIYHQAFYKNITWLFFSNTYIHYLCWWLVGSWHNSLFSLSLTNAENKNHFLLKIIFSYICYKS
jgi:hypothetical protein